MKTNHRMFKLLGIFFVVLIGWYILTTGLSSPLKAQVETQLPEVNLDLNEFITPVEINPDDDELRSKLKERYNAGAELLKNRLQEFRLGRRDLDDVFEAARLVALAKLDLASSEEERLAALEQTLEVAQQIEHSNSRQLALGFGSQGDLARARFARLGVEIEILKMKSENPELQE